MWYTENCFGHKNTLQGCLDGSAVKSMGTQVWSPAGQVAHNCLQLWLQWDPAPASVHLLLCVMCHRGGGSIIELIKINCKITLKIPCKYLMPFWTFRMAGIPQTRCPTLTQDVFTTMEGLGWDFGKWRARSLSCTKWWAGSQPAGLAQRLPCLFAPSLVSSEDLGPMWSRSVSQFLGGNYSRNVSPLPVIPGTSPPYESKTDFPNYLETLQNKEKCEEEN